MIKRFILGVLSVSSVFIFPWWMVFILALAGLFYFDRFYEIIIISIFADVLYGSIHFTGFPYLITFVSIICLYIVSRFKKSLIVY